MPGARTAWMDNIKTWTGLSVEESVRMTEDRDEWRKYVHNVANPRIEDACQNGKAEVCHTPQAGCLSACLARRWINH